MSHGPTSTWTFLTNHALVVFCLAADPDLRLRDLAERIGITERATQRIVSELEDAGYLVGERVGRRKHYAVHLDRRLRHPMERHVEVGDLVELVHRAARGSP